jgi:hypothetical protein
MMAISIFYPCVELKTSIIKRERYHLQGSVITLQVSNK